MMFVLALGFSGMFTLIAKSPFIYMEYFGVSSDLFPLYFGVSILALMGMISVNMPKSVYLDTVFSFTWTL